MAMRLISRSCEEFGEGIGRTSSPRTRIGRRRWTSKSSHRGKVAGIRPAVRIVPAGVVLDDRP